MPVVTAQSYTPLPVYPLFVLLAILTGGISSARMLHRRGVDLRQVAALLLLGVFAGVLGAKIFSALERGGLVWWDLGWEIAHGYRYPGGVLALLGVAPLLRRHLPASVTALQLGDVLAPTIALSMAVVRIGCFLAGCCHGTPSDRFWAVRFAPRSAAWMAHVERGWIDESAAVSLVVHPLQVYFGLSSLAVALLLLYHRRRPRRDGETFFLFLLIDGAIKLGLEQLRLDYQAALAISAALFAAAGAWGWINVTNARAAHCDLRVGDRLELKAERDADGSRRGATVHVEDR